MRINGHYTSSQINAHLCTRVRPIATMVHNLRRAVPSMLGVCRQSIKACAQHADTTIIHSRSFTSSNALSKAQSDALRILFCGSDTFSCESLKALHTEHQRNKALVEQLEVMVLPGKRMGRGYKEIAQGVCSWFDTWSMFKFMGLVADSCSAL